MAVLTAIQLVLLLLAFHVEAQSNSSPIPIVSSTPTISPLQSFASPSPIPSNNVTSILPTSNASNNVSPILTSKATVSPKTNKHNVITLVPGKGYISYDGYTSYVNNCIRREIGQTMAKCKKANSKIIPDNWRLLERCMNKYSISRLECLVAKNRKPAFTCNKWYESRHITLLHALNSTEEAGLKHLECILTEAKTDVLPKCYKGCAKEEPDANEKKDWEFCSEQAAFKFSECYYLLPIMKD